jgi:hypothetical protein
MHASSLPCITPPECVGEGRCASAQLGQGDVAAGTDVTLHNRRFRLHEDALPYGVALHTALALRMLS